MAAHTEKKKKKKPYKGNPKALATKSQKPFKRPKKEDTQQVPASLLVQDDDLDFPRGGRSVLSRQEEAEARAEAEAEFEREESELKKGGGKRKAKGRRKENKRGDDDLGSLFGVGVTGKLPRFANRITLKNISPRMKLWGIVAEVNTKDLVISLPGGLRGFVRAEEVSDIVLDDGNKDQESNMLCSIFRVGQFVSCTVLKVDDDKKEAKGNKRIWLSLRLSLLYKGLALDAVQDGMVLTAQVTSVEDHGYILHFGVSSFTGFLPRKDKDDVEVYKGQLLQCVVKSIDKARAVAYLNADPEVVSKCVTKDLKGLSIDLLVPGMMVNARVHSTLENGLMLSFLTYFTGTVDIFHLQNSFPSGTWKDEYNPNKKVNARILFIDPSTRAVGLTLNSHLIHNKASPLYVKTGEIYDDSVILRVDSGIGLLLQIPTSPMPSPAYVSIYDVADKQVLRLEKKFKEGNHVRIRVLGVRHLEGLAMGTLKASAFEGSVFTHSDVKPGMLVKAKVIAVEEFGAIVQFPSGVKALCPLPHMSELEVVKPAKKFKVGGELLFRVLGCKSKRITVTHKKTLLKSKLSVLASYADAIEGLITHGWITKIEKHGCFVRFYNGVQGFAHRSELGLEVGNEANDVYHVGQVVKCRIISSVPSSRRISLSFVISPKRVHEDELPKIGSITSGIVDQVTSAAIIVHFDNNGYLKGVISNDHLSDNQGQATVLRSALKPGYKFDQLLVLDIEGSNIILSAKYSLINSVDGIPSDVAQIRPLSVVHGYICNIIETGCFVRFLGRLTGFSPKNKVSDGKINNLLDAFYVGQSVRSHILNVISETGRVKLSLMQSLCFSTDVSLILGYFLWEEKIAALQVSDIKGSDFSWVKSFRIGTVVEGEIQEIKEFGVVLAFKDHGDVMGFVPQHHLGGINMKNGSVVRAFVLDVAKSDGLVDLSLKPELIGSAKGGKSDHVASKKKRRRDLSKDLELHQTVNAVVEMVKENYLVLSIPDFNYAIGYASIIDYNTQKLPHRQFSDGQSVVATVGALPSPYTSGRLLLLLKSMGEASESYSARRSKKRSSYSVGITVEAEIIDIKPLELIVKFGTGFIGRIHITEVIDDGHSLENPFGKFRMGQLLSACIVAKCLQSATSRKGYQWELSLRPSVVEGTLVTSGTLMDDNFSIGNTVRGYVVKVDNEWVLLAVTRNIMAHLFVLDSSCEPAELQEFQKRYNVGQAVKGHIISVNKEKNTLRLASHVSSQFDHASVAKDDLSNANTAEHIKKGDIIGGRVKKLLPGVGGLIVQIGPHLFGRVHYTELVDTWVPHPISGFQEGQFVKCRVMEICRSTDGFVHVDLSLRAQLQGNQSAISTAFANNMNSSVVRYEKVDDLHPTMNVQGYVKSVSSKGCFIILSRTIDARVLLSNLSDGYIENPEKEFPVGMLVHGRVLSVDSSSKRVDVTLKQNIENGKSKSDISDFSNLHVGDVVSGNIKRIESYGLFIVIDQTNIVGLCHISEVSDDHIDDIETKYRAGDIIMAKILKVDEKRHRVSLGMKKSYIGDTNNIHTFSSLTNDDEVVDGDSALDDSLLPEQQNNNSLYIQKIFEQHIDGGATALSQTKSRASVLPLQVSLDDSENSDIENDATVAQDTANMNSVVSQKIDRHLKKKEKEQREQEIIACEERNLQKDIPCTEEEFEKLVRSSPNSSYVWIQYMVFLEKTLADIEKARSIAQRALATINFREEAEKLNVWEAYFNLENQYGNPPEEAVKRTFQRALQCCDPKKVHLALLRLYERTEQLKLVDELLQRMTKKFKTSCKVWLYHMQNLLKQGKDGIQSAVNRALLSLPRNKHIKFVTQASLLEFKCGVPDRGRSLFEGILREYPKRTDLWSVYLDQEICLGDAEVIRRLFERVICLSLPPKKMKFLFKKYHDYEKSHGDKQSAENVRQKAVEYVESLK